MAGRLAIACYRPKPGCADALLELMRAHLPTLRGEGLATARVSIVGRAADGTIVEVFEWASQAAVDAAHASAVVQAMWARYAEVCDYVRLADVAEASELFCMLEPVDVAAPARRPASRVVRAAKRAARSAPPPAKRPRPARQGPPAPAARKGPPPARPAKKARPPKRRAAPRRPGRK